jgi:hypothetical protein
MPDKYLPGPLFVFVTILIVLVTVWLGIFGPLPHVVIDWVYGWQTLIGAILAVIAAYFALRNDRIMESNRRARKHEATRAILPLALSQVSEYAERTAKGLRLLIDRCVHETLPTNTMTKDNIQPLPQETLTALAEFVEFSDTINVDVITGTIAWIQILDSRLRPMLEDNQDFDGTVLQNDIEGRIIDCASIHAGASVVFDYARKRSNKLPLAVRWDEVELSLQTMGFLPDYNERIFDVLQRKRGIWSGPLEELREARR